MLVEDVEKIFFIGDKGSVACAWNKKCCSLTDNGRAVPIRLAWSVSVSTLLLLLLLLLLPSLLLFLLLFIVPALVLMLMARL